MPALLLKLGTFLIQLKRGRTDRSDRGIERSADRIIYDQATGRLFYDADGNGARAAVLFRRMEGAPVLTNVDFFAVA